MNIFAVDESPVIAARSLCDVHVVKMILETAQLLSTAVHVVTGADNKEHGLYKPTHINHPSSIWCRENKSNFEWLIHHGVSLNNEWKYRYNHSHNHKSLDVILNASKFYNFFPNGNRTPVLRAMDHEFYRDSVVESYREYYKFKKNTLKLFRYTKREEPEWLH